jgi:hypothetical protein
MTKAPYTFVSHSSKDKPLVYDLATQLANAGLNTWVDVEDLEDGVRWAQVIQQGVESCEAMVVVWSANARASEWVERETLLALRLNKPVLIAQMDDTPLPIYLINRQATDFRKQPGQAAQRIIKTLQKSIKTDATPKPTPKLASKPNEHNFFKYLEQLPDGAECARIARALFAFAEQHANAITFSGTKEPAFHAHLWVGPGGVTVFSVRARRRQPSVEVPLQYWANFPPYDDAAARTVVLEALNRLMPERERFDATRAELRPNLPLARALHTDECLSAFQDVMRDVIERLGQGK